MKPSFLTAVSVAFAASAAFGSTAASADRPAAICGFTTDIRGVEAEVMKPGRYVYEMFADKWIEPKDFGKYAVVYYGEKIAGAAKGKNWKDDESRAAIAKYLDDGGTVVVAGDYCLRQLMGFENKKKPDPLRARIRHMRRLIGRTKADFGKAGRRLGYADDAGNFIVTPEGLEVQKIADEYRAVFASVKGLATLPLEGEWEAKPLGAPGGLTYPTAFPRRPTLGKPAARRDGLVLFDGAAKATIALGGTLADDKCPTGAVRMLAGELAWHLEKMCGARFDVVDGEPESGPALVYRELKRPAGFERGEAAYFKIWREGGKVILGGDPEGGLSRATTYVLEALGCRYIWPGETGKIVPRRDKVVLPEIAVEDATPFVIRRIRLYGKPEWRDRPENRDFYRWHGMNDMSYMNNGWPGPLDDYQWGHYYKDYYPKYYKTHRDWFALQPDGTRNLHLGSHPERPTFCLSNRELAKFTAERIKEGFRADPSKKCLSLCLPDGATATQCMCEECRRMDPVNAAKGSVTVFFPERRRVPYVASTDRVFEFMNRIAEEVEKEFPDKLLSCYAYGGYTAPPVKTVPHRNLVILSVAGYYASYGRGDEVERNLCAWRSFGNKILWRPNAHGGFYIAVPDNEGRRMFDDISLMAANGIFGVDYDTMSNEWATKPLMYYAACKAHFNPDGLDYDSVADDWCRAGFGPGWRHVREYFDIVERACLKASKENSEAPPPVNWAQRVAAACRLPNATDYDALDRCLAAARAEAGGDEAVLFRIGRLEFGTGLGRRMKKIRAGKATPEEKEEARRFIREYLEKDPSSYEAGHGRLVVK